MRELALCVPPRAGGGGVGGVRDEYGADDCEAAPGDSIVWVAGQFPS